MCQSHAKGAKRKAPSPFLRQDLNVDASSRIASPLQQSGDPFPREDGDSAAQKRGQGGTTKLMMIEDNCCKRIVSQTTERVHSGQAAEKRKKKVYPPAFNSQKHSQREGQLFPPRRVEFGNGPPARASKIISRAHGGDQQTNKHHQSSSTSSSKELVDDAFEGFSIAV